MAPKKKSCPPPIQNQLERFILAQRREARGIELYQFRRLPYPGHMEIFLTGLHVAMYCVRMTSANIVTFSVIGYADGQLNVKIESDNPACSSITDETADTIASLSARTCVVCRVRPVKRASRFAPDGHPVSLCTRRRHRDDYVEHLLHLDTYLKQVREGMRGVKFPTNRQIYEFLKKIDDDYDRIGAE
jgi:hypothetical protein